MIFNLNEGKWLSFARTLSKHSLPKIRRISLDYIPSDSNDVGDFMINSINSENFEFNKNKQIQIDGSKYFSSLMKVAEKTSNYFNVYNTKLSAHEFCGIIESAKSVKELGFIYSLVSLDSEIDFGDNMKDCKIECINLSYSGGSVYSNWSAYPERFENMISSISKCAPLVKSLKSLIIQYCDLTREKSQAILNKYKMNKVELQGV